MTDQTPNKRKEALDFLQQQETGILSTVHDGAPSSRLLYFIADDTFNVYFITLANTRKVAEIKANPHVAFVVATTDIPKTLQIEGTVEDLTATAVNDSLLVEFVRKLTSHTKYNIPITHLDTGELKFYRITPTWLRYGDFTIGEETADVMTEVQPSE